MPADSQGFVLVCPVPPLSSPPFPKPLVPSWERVPMQVACPAWSKKVPGTGQAGGNLLEVVWMSPRPQDALGLYIASHIWLWNSPRKSFSGKWKDCIKPANECVREATRRFKLNSRVCFLGVWKNEVSVWVVGAKASVTWKWKAHFYLKIIGKGWKESYF